MQARHDIRGAVPDLAIALLLFAFGAYLLVRSIGYGLFAGGGRIGPGFMPFVAGALLAAFSTWVGVQVVTRSRRAVPDGPPAEEDERPRTRTVSNRKVLLILGLTVLATMLTYVVGYVVAFGCLTFVLLAAVERKRLWLSAPVALASAVVAWLVFVALLGVPLPGGALHLLGGG